MNFKSSAKEKMTAAPNKPNGFPPRAQTAKRRIVLLHNPQEFWRQTSFVPRTRSDASSALATMPTSVIVDATAALQPLQGCRPAPLPRLLPAHRSTNFEPSPNPAAKRGIVNLEAIDAFFPAPIPPKQSSNKENSSPPHTHPCCAQHRHQTRQRPPKQRWF